MLLERVTLVLRAVAIVGAALFITFLALPSPTRSTAWKPPRAPNLDGPYLPNDALLKADRVAPGELVGPEDVVIDAAGRLYAGTVDGKIVRTRTDGSLEIFTDTGGRPLGLAFAPDGDLYVADVIKGLLRVDKEGNIEVLVHVVEGRELIFTNDLDVAKDGTVYFSDSSEKWTYGDHVFEILEQNPSGRLLKWDPRTRQTTVLLRGLAFANGVALSADESYLLVTETARYQITRFWLQGEKRNLAEVFSENLPGFPDNLTRTERGTYWVAMFSVRKSLLDRLHPHPFIKDCFASLPETLRPRQVPWGLLVELDGDGKPIRSLHDPTGRRFRDLSSVIENNGVVYFGTLTGTALGRYVLKNISQAQP